MDHVPKNYWENPAHHQDFMGFVAQFFRWTNPQDCMTQLERRQIKKLGGDQLFQYYKNLNSLKEALCPFVTSDFGPLKDVDFLTFKSSDTSLETHEDLEKAADDGAEDDTFVEVTFTAEDIGTPGTPTLLAADEQNEASPGEPGSSSGALKVSVGPQTSVAHLASTATKVSVTPKFSRAPKASDEQKEPVEAITPAENFDHAATLRRGIVNWILKDGYPSYRLEEKQPLRYRLYNFTNLDLKQVAEEMMPFWHQGLVYQQALAAAFPELGLEMWGFPEVPPGFWKDTQNQKAFLKSLAKHRGWRTVKDFSHITDAHVRCHGGRMLLGIHGSARNLVMAVYSDKTWYPWLFPNLPDAFWDTPANRTAFVAFVAKAEGWVHHDDFYQFDVDVAARYGGEALFTRSKKFRAIDLLQEFAPHELWRPWKMNVPGGVDKVFWAPLTNQLDFLQAVARGEKWNRIEDCLNMNASVLLRYNGNGLMEFYKKSMVNLRATLCHQLEWGVATNASPAFETSKRHITSTKHPKK